MQSSSSSSSSSSSPVEAQHEIDPGPRSLTDSNHQDGFKKGNKNRQTAKPLDLNSYFDDVAETSSSNNKRSKPSLSIVRSTRRALRFKGVPKHQRRNTTHTVPPSRDEGIEYDEDDDDDENDDDVEWVRERWNQLMDRQRLAEADVRRTILNRDRLGPLELSRWLDSDDTCTLPLPTLGVQLRMMQDN